MDSTPKKKEQPAERHRWRSLFLILLLLLAVWGFLVPNFLGRRFLHSRLDAFLNNPEHALSCERIAVDFSYADLLLRRRVKEISASGIKMDASRFLSGAAAQAFTNRLITADFRLIPDIRAAPGNFRSGDGLLAELRGSAFAHPFLLQARVTLPLTNLVSAVGTASFALASRMRAADVHASEEEFIANSPWRISADFGASPFSWQINAQLPEFTLNEQEPLVAEILRRLLTDELRRALSFSGRLGAILSARKTREIPVPIWEARAPIRDLRLDLVSGNEPPLTVRNFRVNLGASGIADRTSVLPAVPRIDLVEAGGFAFTNVFASLQMTDRALFVTHAGAGFCGGSVNIYALRLDPASLSTGFTLLVDNLDTGLLFPRLAGFDGTATGRLHGKLPLSLRNGCELRLRDAFIYSTPGETGTIRMTNAASFIDNLGGAGLDDDSRKNLSHVLEHLDYQVLGIELLRDEADALALRLKVDGSATRGKTTVPVDFNVTFHGDLEHLVNTGLKATRKR